MAATMLMDAATAALWPRALTAAGYRRACSPHEWTDEDSGAMADFILALAGDGVVDLPGPDAASPAYPDDPRPPADRSFMVASVQLRFCAGRLQQFYQGVRPPYAGWWLDVEQVPDGSRSYTPPLSIMVAQAAGELP